MSLLDRLEHRYGRFAIPGLIRYVVALNALVYVLVKINPRFLLALVLWPSKILQGEIWRLVTYIFIPQFGSFILPEALSAAMYLFFLWWVGNLLEETLGAFRLNLYYFTGMLGITAAGFLFGAGFGAAILNTSLLFALAQFYPDETIFLYFIPVKMKWLAWIAAFGLAYEFLTSGDWSYRLSLIVCLANYFIFFGPEIVRNARTRHQVAERRRKFEAARAPETETLHRCTVCHRTEAGNPDLEFRVARDGHEYCLDHLPKPAVPG